MKKCDARVMHGFGADHNFDGYHLWLRNNIFYYRVELPRENNKRRYKRISLHTGNFYEAREKIKVMNTNIKDVLAKIRNLYSSLDFETYIDLGSFVNSGNHGILNKLDYEKKRLSKNNKLQDVENLLALTNTAEQSNLLALNSDDRELLKEVIAMRPLLNEFIEATKNIKSKNNLANAVPPAQSRTIAEVLNTMLLKGNNGKSEQIRKRNTITALLFQVKLTLDNDYSKFHNTDTIDSIARFIVSQSDAKGDKKRRQIRYIKELATCGTNIDSDNYKANVILNLPKIEKTKRSEKNPHLPYSQAQLLEIFNPKHAFFKMNLDAFYVCLIALYTGSRVNGAITLQYDDVFEQDGMPCIYFRENHPLKQLKNEASERIVPIHSQLLDLGFVDYVRNRQKNLNAKGTDFIFPKCQTKSGQYNNKYTGRVILNFFQKIGVKSYSHDGYDFHSFRKNASIAMQDAHIIDTYVKDIIGWEGKSTMEQYYSNHTLPQIKAELEKFNYHFLSDHFAKWKEIIKKAK